MKNRLLKIRIKKGLSQSDFAVALGEKEQRIRNIETGRQKMHLDLIVLLVQKMQIDPMWLLTGKGEMYVTDEKESSFIHQQDKNDLNESLIMQDENHKRLVDFLNYYAQTANANDFAWLEGQIKRNVSDYADFISMQCDIKKRA